MTSAGIIANALHAAGVRQGFVVPGGEVLDLIDALAAAGIALMVGRHENACGFMAEGAYRADGAPGLLVVTVGPGVSNAMTAVANAAQEHVPLIIVSGKVDDAVALRYTHQIFDHQAAMAPFCKASFEVTADAADLAIDKAIHLATSGRPGPVHLDLPLAVARRDHPPHRNRRPATASSVSPTAGVEFDLVRDRFHSAQRPLMIVGQEAAVEPGIDDVVTAFAEANGVPVVTTYKAKGVIDEHHSLALGGHGLSPLSDDIVLGVIGEADFVITAGYDPIEMRAGWHEAVSPERTVSFTRHVNDHFVHREDTWFPVPPSAGLIALAGRTDHAAGWLNGPVAAAQEQLAAAFAADGWGPTAVFETLNRVVSNDAVVTVDSGAHRILLSQVWRCRRPQTLLQSSGLCTMGAALPMAIGWASAAPGRPAIAVMGDGCLDMMMGELATLRDSGLPVTCVVLVDDGYELIAKKQRSSGLASSAVQFGGRAGHKTDYVGVAQAIDIAATAVENEEQFINAIAAGRDKPSLVEIRIPRGSYDGRI